MSGVEKRTEQTDPGKDCERSVKSSFRGGMTIRMF